MRSFQSILVTGGAGFIGSHFVRNLVTRYPDCHVTVIDKLTYAGNIDNLSDVMQRIHFVQGDICEPADARTAMEGATAVVHFAAESHVDRSLADARPFIRTNVEGTLVLLEAARKFSVSRFLHVSTDEVYGDLAGTDRHSLETDPFSPRSPYAASKAAAEHLVKSYVTSYGLDAVITRGANTYGPFQFPEKIIPLFITNALENQLLPVYGNGMAERDYLYVEDHVSGIDLVLRNGEIGEAYNLGARMGVTGIMVATEILRLLGQPQELLHFVIDRPGHDYRYSVDPTRAEVLGWRRQWSFPSGLQHTVRWYQQHEDWWRRCKQTISAA